MPWAAPGATSPRCTWRRTSIPFMCCITIAMTRQQASPLSDLVAGLSPSSLQGYARSFAQPLRYLALWRPGARAAAVSAARPTPLCPPSMACARACSIRSCPAARCRPMRCSPPAGILPGAMPARPNMSSNCATGPISSSAGQAFKETEVAARLRYAACLLADIGWRAHPDYRAERSLGMISQAAFVGIDHPGRVFLALTIFYRYEGEEMERWPDPSARRCARSCGPIC